MSALHDNILHKQQCIKQAFHMQNIHETYVMTISLVNDNVLNSLQALEVEYSWEVYCMTIPFLSDNVLNFLQALHMQYIHETYCMTIVISNDRNIIACIHLKCNILAKNIVLQYLSIRQCIKLLVKEIFMGTSRAIYS